MVSSSPRLGMPLTDPWPTRPRTRRHSLHDCVAASARKGNVHAGVLPCAVRRHLPHPGRTRDDAQHQERGLGAGLARVVRSTSQGYYMHEEASHSAMSRPSGRAGQVRRRCAIAKGSIVCSPAAGSWLHCAAAALGLPRARAGIPNASKRRLTPCGRVRFMAGLFLAPTRRNKHSRAIWIPKPKAALARAEDGWARSAFINSAVRLEPHADCGVSYDDGTVLHEGCLFDAGLIVAFTLPHGLRSTKYGAPIRVQCSAVLHHETTCKTYERAVAVSRRERGRRGTMPMPVPMPRMRCVRGGAATSPAARRRDRGRRHRR